MLINKSPFVILVICCKNYKQRIVKRKFTFTVKIINNKKIRFTFDFTMGIVHLLSKVYAKLA